jgi:hypothetical protein
MVPSATERFAMPGVFAADHRARSHLMHRPKKDPARGLPG